MQIIVDDHTEIKYYRQCLEQINNKYSQNIVVDKCTVIDICDLCIETLVQDFIIFWIDIRIRKICFNLCCYILTWQQKNNDQRILSY